MNILLNSNTLVLTANQRLAHSMRLTYNQQQSKSQRVWSTPQILPMANWFKILWNTHFFSSDNILTDHQEQQLWSLIIQETRQSFYPLLQVDNTAQLVQQAWELVHYWQIPLDKIKQQAISPEVNLFIEWADQFTHHCQNLSLQSAAVLPAKLQIAFTHSHFTLPQHIIVAGFDELPPAHRTFLETIKPFTTLTEIAQQLENCSIHQRTFPDLESEITAMAQWAKMQIATHPQARIGCVAPQLTQHRASILSIFNQVFAEAQPPPFNIASGQNLSSFDLISTGLQVLSLHSDTLPLTAISSLLQSPYLCQNEADMNLGALLDVECRKPGRPEVTLAVLYKAIGRWQPHYPQQTWLERLRAFFGAAYPEDLQQPPSAWASCFLQQLQALGWPGGRALNSLEYQVIHRWQELLTELAELDAITGSISRKTALHSLQRLAIHTLFQPKTEFQSPIQILGLLESSGFHFDGLWIMGLDDHNWPPSPQPNPFLPYSLQNQYRLPHSSAQRELIYAQKITQRLLNSAQEVWISCAAPEPGQSARLSRLMPTPPQAEATSLTSPAITRYSELIFNSRHTEQIYDQYGPPVSNTTTLRGGSSLFTKQAQCPFQAFAVFRLKALALDEPELGISSRIHGILLHQVLERLWKALNNQHHLLTLQAADLENLLSNTIDQVMREELSEPDSSFAQIEKNRLAGIIHEWLVLEKQRPPFTVIEQESERFIEIAGLRIQLKIDRIDQLSNGGQLLIDYKTGLTAIPTWLDARLQQPQLPLYVMASSTQNHCCGVAFAQLHIGQLGFKGLHTEQLESATYFPRGVISVDNYSDPNAPKTWGDLIAHWRGALEKLAMDFYQGYASVDPVESGNSPCLTCNLQSLCRIKT